MLLVSLTSAWQDHDCLPVYIAKTSYNPTAPVCFAKCDPLPLLHSHDRTITIRCTCVVDRDLLLCGQWRYVHSSCLALLQAMVKTELRAQSEKVALAGAASLVMMTHAQELQQQVLVECYCVHVHLICSSVFGSISLSTN